MFATLPLRYSGRERGRSPPARGARVEGRVRGRQGVDRAQPAGDGPVRRRRRRARRGGAGGHARARPRRSLRRAGALVGGRTPYGARTRAYRRRRDRRRPTGGRSPLRGGSRVGRAPRRALLDRLELLERLAAGLAVTKRAARRRAEDVLEARLGRAAVGTAEDLRLQLDKPRR